MGWEGSSGILKIEGFSSRDHLSWPKESLLLQGLDTLLLDGPLSTTYWQHLRVGPSQPSGQVGMLPAIRCMATV